MRENRLLHNHQASGRFRKGAKGYSLSLLDNSGNVAKRMDVAIVIEKTQLTHYS